MAGRPLDPIITAATMFSVDRLVAQHGGSVPRPAGNDLESLWQYWAAASAIVGADLSLRVAADLPIGAFGLASYGLVSAANLAGALEMLSTTYLERLVPGLKLRVVAASREHTDVRMQCEDEDPHMALIEEIVLAVIHRHFSLLAKPATLVGVALRRPAPEDASPWRAFFGVPARFGQRYSALRLDSASLGIELRTASPELHSIVRAAGEAESVDPSTSAQVRRYVRAHLTDAIDAPAVAEALSMTARTLQRKLLAEQTSLRDIVAETRIEVAKNLLEQTERTIADISEAVGFAQPASFSRAFTAATGETPADYRRRHQEA